MRWDEEEVEFANLIGKTIIKIHKTDDQIDFSCSDGDIFEMYHDQDCCATVTVEDICGDLDDLLNTPILSSSEESNCNDTDYGSEIWTFYKVSTIKGSITIRWYGESNGHYSESVSFKLRDKAQA